MSGEGVLLDSVILIDHFNGHEAATRYLLAAHGEASISAITRAEVLTGFSDDERALPTALLDRLPLLVIDGPIADLAARLRREQGWRLPDALQAATALHHGLRLATRNTRDFPPERFAFVHQPYSL